MKNFINYYFIITKVFPFYTYQSSFLKETRKMNGVKIISTGNIKKVKISGPTHKLFCVNIKPFFCSFIRKPNLFTHRVISFFNISLMIQFIILLTIKIQFYNTFQ